MTDLKALTQGLFDGIGAGSDIDATVDKYMAEDFVEHENVPGMDNTRETPRQMFKMMHAAFPDFHVNMQEMLQDGDKVVARLTMAGTHEGDFMGMPPSGNPFEINVIDIMQFRDDMCIAHWGVMDMAGLMEQIGATH
jgi:steroid delta-isomerase-like uncharacterized protein